MRRAGDRRERQGQPPKPVIKHILRPRTILYTSLWSLVGLGLLFALFIRADIDLTVAPVRNPTFVTLSDGSVRNTYEVRLRNKHGETRPFTLSVSDNDAVQLELEGTADATVEVGANAQRLQRVYLIAPAGSPAAQAERSDVRLWVEDEINGDRVYKDTIFNGKANQ